MLENQETVAANMNVVIIIVVNQPLLSPRTLSPNLANCVPQKRLFSFNFSYQFIKHSSIPNFNVISHIVETGNSNNTDWQMFKTRTLPNFKYFVF